MIHDSLLTHFRALRDLEVVDKGGYSSLIVYAEKTVNDPRNPNGYAFAIAHTNSYELRLAYENLRGIDDVNVRAVRTVAERALRDDLGLLRHLNVAHLDGLPSEKLDAADEEASCLTFMSGRKSPNGLTCPRFLISFDFRHPTSVFTSPLPAPREKPKG